MATNPMHQFEVYRIGPKINFENMDISFTNSSLFMLISALSILLLLFIGTKRKAIIPSKIQLISEICYAFVSKMISDTAGPKAKPFFPFIFTSFLTPFLSYSYLSSNLYLNVSIRRRIFSRRGFVIL